MELTTCASRIAKMIEPDGPYDVARKFALRGAKLTPQAVYKWLDGGEIEERNLRLLCDIYGGDPAFIRYGITMTEALTNGQKAAAELVKEAPPEMMQMTLDFLEYQINRPTAPEAVQQKLASYMLMIDRIKRSMDEERGPQPSE